jgi:hypothetical protein
VQGQHGLAPSGKQERRVSVKSARVWIRPLLQKEEGEFTLKLLCGVMQQRESPPIHSPQKPGVGFGQRFKRLVGVQIRFETDNFQSLF